VPYKIKKKLSYSLSSVGLYDHLSLPPIGPPTLYLSLPVGQEVNDLILSQSSLPSAGKNLELFDKNQTI
jgi:hypothetical protein